MNDKELLEWFLAEWFNIGDEPHEPSCEDEYCGPCAARECRYLDPLHRHHDGCPSDCYEENKMPP